MTRLADGRVIGGIGFKGQPEGSTVLADTILDNLASQRTLVGAGFWHVRTDAELQYFEALLDDGHQTA